MRKIVEKGGARFSFRVVRMVTVQSFDRRRSVATRGRTKEIRGWTTYGIPTIERYGAHVPRAQCGKQLIGTHQGFAKRNEEEEEANREPSIARAETNQRKLDLSRK